MNMYLFLVLFPCTNRLLLLSGRLNIAAPLLALSSRPKCFSVPNSRDVSPLDLVDLQLGPNPTVTLSRLRHCRFSDCHRRLCFHPNSHPLLLNLTTLGGYFHHTLPEPYTSQPGCVHIITTFVTVTSLFTHDYHHV